MSGMNISHANAVAALQTILGPQGTAVLDQLDGVQDGSISEEVLQAFVDQFEAAGISPEALMGLASAQTQMPGMPPYMGGGYPQVGGGVSQNQQANNAMFNYLQQMGIGGITNMTPGGFGVVGMNPFLGHSNAVTSNFLASNPQFGAISSYMTQAPSASASFAQTANALEFQTMGLRSKVEELTMLDPSQFPEGSPERKWAEAAKKKLPMLMMDLEQQMQMKQMLYQMMSNIIKKEGEIANAIARNV